MKQASFKISKGDSRLIDRIGQRALDLLGADFLSTVMDITATHANGCRLKLLKLLESSDFDFSHDVNGIYNNLDRVTGELQNCFFPRAAR
jgi:hypothetical protein